MVERRLTFTDAVRLLGGESNAVGRINKFTGGAVAATAVATVGDVDFFALRNEVAMWGNSAIKGIRERSQGLSRFDRTQRLVAAHSVIVVTSFYQALDEVMATSEPRMDLSRAELTKREQVALATGEPPARRYAEMVASLVGSPPPMPAPHLPFEKALDALRRHYQTVGDRLLLFLVGLKAFERDTLRDTLQEKLRRVPAVAVSRYAETYRALMVQAPEFAVWSGMVEGQATRAAVAKAVSDLRAELARMHQAGQERIGGIRRGLCLLYRGRLTRSILSTSDAPQHITLPTLEQAYVKPHGLIAVAGSNDQPATETWWQGRPTVDDVLQLLFGHFTSPSALEQPIVVLGQPGSGKSLLTEALAAELPESDFLVVRVELRKVHADSSVQQQIERALYHLLGETVTWPDLVRDAGRALPVVIMDGFDELLQATKAHRADYLELLREFQQREAELGRPVAILVTSRTVVADRARLPQGTVIVRLEPFEEPHVATWLDVWNTVNEENLRERGLSPLPIATVLQYAELASQPLLLLLLALYDAGNNALQRAGNAFGRVDLYEQLFADFVAREVRKVSGPEGPDQREREIEAEWRRLSAVAVAILNRSADVITEAELGNDINHLLTPDDLAMRQSDSLRGALTPGQLLVGRFFFIHESQASRGTGALERSFEFLHATFGEFLAARRIVAVLVETAEDRNHLRRRPGAVLDAGFLYAITSFITVARRAPLWEFCRGLINRLTPRQRDLCRELVIELLPDAGYPHPTWSMAGYEPRRKPVAARIATYTSNLACFAVLTSEQPVDATELVGEPVTLRWRAQALLWQSQLDPEDRQRLWQVLRVAWNLADEPTRLMVRIEDSSPIRVYESIPWPADGRPSATLNTTVLDVAVPSDSHVGRSLRKSAFVQTAHEVREHLYALMPYWRTCGDTMVAIEQETLISGAGALLELLLNPMRSRDEREDRKLLYITALRHGSPEQRRLALIQLVRDAVYLDLDTIVQISSDASGHLEKDLLQLASALCRMSANAHSTEEIASRLESNLEIGQIQQLIMILMGIDLPTVPPRLLPDFRTPRGSRRNDID